jgi:hypothetical protein
MVSGRIRLLGYMSPANRSLEGQMDRFASHYLLRLDAKGRVSMPAAFRAELTEAAGKVRAFKRKPGSRTVAARSLGARER